MMQSLKLNFLEHISRLNIILFNVSYLIVLVEGIGAAGSLLVVDSSRLKIESAYISNKTVWSVIAPSKQVTDL